MTEEVYELHTFEDFLKFAEENKSFTRDRIQDISVAKISHEWIGRALHKGFITEPKFHEYKWIGANTNTTTIESTYSTKQNTSYPFDEEVRVGLYESKKETGPLRPVFIAKSSDEEINNLPIDGFHRLSVDSDWPKEYRKVNDWREYYQLRFQANIQHRKDHPEQLKRDLNAYCEKLEEMGVGKQNCSARVLEHLALGYNPDYLRTLIDPQYKDQSKSKAAKSSVIMTSEEEKEIEKEIKEKEKAKERYNRYEVVISMCVTAAVQIVQQKRNTRCPHCRKKVPVPPVSDFESVLMQKIENALSR